MTLLRPYDSRSAGVDHNTTKEKNTMTHPDNDQNSSDETEEIILLKDAIDLDDPMDDEVILLTEDEPSPLSQMAGQVPEISEAQIEAALEKVIRDIYGEKIERMIVDVIEDFTTSEMNRIKSTILEEDDRGVRF